VPEDQAVPGAHERARHGEPAHPLQWLRRSAPGDLHAALRTPSVPISYINHTSRRLKPVFNTNLKTYV
jgi:hypothetical protein